MHVQEQSKELGKEYSQEMLMEFLKIVLNKQKTLSMHLHLEQVPFKGDKPLFTVYNEKKRRWIGEVEKGSNCTAVVEAAQVC